VFESVLGIRIRTFWAFLQYPHPDPLVTSTDPDPAPNPSIIKQKL